VSGRLAAAGDDGVITVWDPNSVKLNQLIPDRQYERLDLFGTRGLTDAQQVVLRSQGATTEERREGNKPPEHQSNTDGNALQAHPSTISPREGDPRTSSGNRWPVMLLVLLAVLLVIAALFFLIYFIYFK
jgi:hypothetical protein